MVKFCSEGGVVGSDQRASLGQVIAVSYTHLDVYKRQTYTFTIF